MKTAAHPTRELPKPAASAKARRTATAGGAPLGVHAPGVAHTLDTISIRHPSAAVPVARRLQRKLTIGDPGDASEREADRVADALVGAPAHTGNRAHPQIQRLPSCGPAHAEVPASVMRTLAEPGLPLARDVRSDMEARFGHDFSRVRVHADRDASQSARDVSARAYTVGSQIVFGPSRYAPATTEGRRLLTHELTHVVQQGAATPLHDAGMPMRPALRPAAPVLARDPEKDPVTTDPNVVLARELAKKLAAGKRDEVQKTLEDAKTDKAALEVAATQALDKDSGDRLRRMIRFVRNKPGAGVPDTAKSAAERVSITDQGKVAPKTAAKVAGGNVEIRTGVSFSGGGATSKEAFSLTYTGAAVDDKRWLQFIWRELVPEFPPATKGGKPRTAPVDKPLSHSGRDYRTTTDPARPIWNTDAGTRSSPFYEANTSVKRTDKELTLIDAPSPMADDVADLFKRATPPTKVTMHFHARTYLVDRMDVLYRGDIDVTFEFTSATVPAATIKATGGPADHIDPLQHATLKAQDPKVDYLPGPSSNALGEFDRVADLFPTGSLSAAQWNDRTNVADIDRFKDIVSIAHAEWINETSGSPAGDIHASTDVSTDIKPGLNFFAKLPQDGQTGYLDAANVFHNPDLPIDPKAGLPRVAIVLGQKAFARDKDWALTVLRHELRHAVHAQLTVRWLFKWRESGSKKNFGDWLKAEVKAKRISQTDRALAITGLKVADPTGGHFDLTATEVFAHAEGIITALPLLPAQPDLQSIAGDKYPAAIRAIKESFSNFNAGATFRPAAHQQIHDAACELGQRDALLAWLDFLIKPSSVKASTATEKQTVTMVTTDFGPGKSLLEEMRKAVKKGC